MNTYEVEVFRATPEDMDEIIRALSNANIEFEVSGTRVWVEFDSTTDSVRRAVSVINDLGFETDEDDIAPYSTNQEMHDAVVAELERMGWTKSDSDDYNTWLTKSVNVEGWDVYLTVELPLDDPEDEATDILYPIVESNVTIRYPDDYTGEGITREIVENVASGVSLENITDNFPDHAYIDFIATGDVVRGSSPEALAGEINGYADGVAENTAGAVADTEDEMGF